MIWFLMVGNSNSHVHCVKELSRSHSVSVWSNTREGTHIGPCAVLGLKLNVTEISNTNIYDHFNVLFNITHPQSGVKTCTESAL